MALVAQETEEVILTAKRVDHVVERNVHRFNIFRMVRHRHRLLLRYRHHHLLSHLEGGTHGTFGTPFRLVPSVPLVLSVCLGQWDSHAACGLRLTWRCPYGLQYHEAISLLPTVSLLRLPAHLGLPFADGHVLAQCR